MNADLERARKDAADRAALNAYVAALSPEHRAAYHRANPDYMVGGFPAYLVDEARALADAGQRDAGQLLLRDWSDAQIAARAEQAFQLARPRIGDRIAGALAGVLTWGLYALIGAAGAYVAGAPALAAGLATVCALLGTLSAMCGFATGGRE